MVVLVFKIKVKEIYWTKYLTCSARRLTNGDKTIFYKRSYSIIRLVPYVPP